MKTHLFLQVDNVKTFTKNLLFSIETIIFLMEAENKDREYISSVSLVRQIIDGSDGIIPYTLNHCFLEMYFLNQKVWKSEINTKILT